MSLAVYHPQSSEAQRELEMAPEYSDWLSIVLQWMERRRRDSQLLFQKELYQLRFQWNAWTRDFNALSPYLEVLPGGTSYPNESPFITSLVPWRSRLATHQQSIQEYRKGLTFYAPGY